MRQIPKRPGLRRKGGTCWFVGRIITAYPPFGTSARLDVVCEANSVIVLVSAGNPSVALRKLERIGKFGEGKCVRRGRKICRQTFVGLGDVSPVYEPLADGREIYDEGWRSCKLSTLNREVPAKKDLLREMNRIETRRIRFGCAPMWH